MVYSQDLTVPCPTARRFKIKTIAFFISVSGFFMELVSCVRFRVEEPPDERPQTRFTNLYSAHSLVLSVENRDSMALLAAIFTGKFDL